jgi:hypothetical protein
MKIKLNKTILIVIVIFITAILYMCSPSVEDVSYTQYTGRGKNHLLIYVNTKRGLFTGRESFLQFKRVRYSFSFATKGDDYNEKEMEITIHGMGHDGWTILPRHGHVKITDKPPFGITVKVDVDDNRILRTINGSYYLRRLETDSEHIYYDK